MRAVDLIRKKRDGEILSPQEIEWLVEHYTDGTVGDEQMAAFAMAVFFRDMNAEELTALTHAMLQSGTVLDWNGLPGLRVDKHSTGGVGDKISLCLAPLVAACGVGVPMISGRALGHTGGTLDKLAAIPGFRTSLGEREIKEMVERHGLVFAAQTESIAPADRKLYALRDVTATVPSIPLIAASIMSKKLAEGIDGLVLDTKCGSGAFMKTISEARSLARAMIDIGHGMGKRVRALITSMDQVLGRTCGNADESWEAFEVLRGRGPDDVVALTVELGAEMLVLGDVAQDVEEGRRKIREAITDGRGLQKLQAVVEAQGGDPRAIEDRSFMPQAKQVAEIRVPNAGFVSSWDVEGLGWALMTLGAGRARASDPVDLSVSIEVLVRLGEEVKAGQVWARVKFNEAHKEAAARPLLERAIRVSEIQDANLVDAARVMERLVMERLGDQGAKQTSEGMGST